jgi:hypothetical protein
MDRIAVSAHLIISALLSLILLVITAALSELIFYLVINLNKEYGLNFICQQKSVNGRQYLEKTRLKLLLILSVAPIILTAIPIEVVLIIPETILITIIFIPLFQ